MTAAKIGEKRKRRDGSIWQKVGDWQRVSEEGSKEDATKSDKLKEWAKETDKDHDPELQKQITKMADAVIAKRKAYSADGIGTADKPQKQESIEFRKDFNQAEAEHILGFKIPSGEDLASLGGLEGAKVRISAGADVIDFVTGEHVLRIESTKILPPTAEHPNGIKMNSIRAIHKDEDGKLVLHNEIFTVTDPKSIKTRITGLGNGPEMLSRQVQQARRMGVDRIETAARGEGFVGYNVWARMGRCRTRRRSSTSYRPTCQAVSQRSSTGTILRSPRS